MATPETHRGPPNHEQAIADNGGTLPQDTNPLDLPHSGTLPQDTNPLDLLRGLGLDPSWQSENPELKDLTKAVKALADDISKQLGAIGNRLGALESGTKLTLNHVVSPIDTSTPAPEVRNGTSNAPRVLE